MHGLRLQRSAGDDDIRLVFFDRLKFLIYFDP